MPPAGTLPSSPIPTPGTPAAPGAPAPPPRGGEGGTRSASDSSSAATPPGSPAPAAGPSGVSGAPAATGQAAPSAANGAPKTETSAATTARGAAPRAGVGEPTAPSFDVVRVEPNGESVIAGRAAPGATVDLMANGQSLARVVADSSGLFAFVPPALPPGTHEVVLQTIAPDGTRARSAQSVTVAISPGRNQQPLVTVSAPDQPTVVLSRPEEPKGDTPPGQGGPARPAAVANASPPAVDGAGSSPNPQAPPRPAPRPEVRIASVDAQGDRLFVAGLAAPGSTLRLYLNDSYVAPGATASDGRLSFTIGKGVRPGDYRVRLDDVDPISGAVRSRAEVPFTVPEPFAVAALTGPGAPAPGGSTAGAGSTSLPPAAPVAGGALPGPGAVSQPGAGPASPVPEQAPAIVGSRPGQTAAAEPTSGTGGGPAAAPLPSPNGGAPAASMPGAPRPSPATEGGAGPGRVASAPQGAGDVADPARPGAAVARREAAVGTDPGQVLVPEVNTAIVARGDNLWRISKRTYGEGLRYTVIFGANSPQIRNPDLIYPGQVFVLPAQSDTPSR